MDPTERLYQNRVVLIAGEIEDSEETVLRIFTLNQEDPEGPIYVYIDSGGGSFSSAGHIYDAITHSYAPVHGLVTGRAFSSAFWILQACDQRLAWPNAELLFHSGTVTIPMVNAHYLKHYFKQMQEKTRELLKKLAERSGQDLKKLKGWNDSERRFLASEALELGFIDGIPSPSKTTPEEAA